MRKRKQRSKSLKHNGNVLYAVVRFALSELRLFVAESYSRNTGKLKDAESGRLTVCDGIQTVGNVLAKRITAVRTGLAVRAAIELLNLK